MKKVLEFNKIICYIIKVLKKSEAFKSNQIIVADETRDIVKNIRKIKEYKDNTWLPWEDEILRQYYPTEGAVGCMKRINERRKKLGI